MPEIPLLAQIHPGADSQVHLALLFGVMRYPNDQEARDTWTAVAYAKSYVLLDGTGLSPEELNYARSAYHVVIPALLAAKQAPEEVLEAPFLGKDRAYLAGQTLAILVTCARHHRKHVSVSRAIELAAYQYKRDNCPGDDPMDYSSSRATKAWKEFKTVSHLWADFLLATRSGVDTTDARFFPTALGFAQNLLREAAEAGILRLDEAWTIPAHLRLPALPVELLPLTGDDLEFLNQGFPTPARNRKR